MAFATELDGATPSGAPDGASAPEQSAASSSRPATTTLARSRSPQQPRIDYYTRAQFRVLPGLFDLYGRVDPSVWHRTAEALEDVEAQRGASSPPVTTWNRARAAALRDAAQVLCVRRQLPRARYPDEAHGSRDGMLPDTRRPVGELAFSQRPAVLDYFFASEPLSAQAWGTWRGAPADHAIVGA